MRSFDMRVSLRQNGSEALTYQRLGYLLTGVPARDLYALLSKCDDVQRREFPGSAIFWNEIKPSTHDQ